MNFINSNIKLFAILFVGTLTLAIILSFAGALVEPVIRANFNETTISSIGYFFKITYIILFVIMALTSVPLIPYICLNLLQAMLEHSISQTLAQLCPKWMVHMKDLILSHKEQIISVFSYSLWTIYIVGTLIVLILV